LQDFKTALERDHLTRWLAGRLDPDTESEAKGRCLAVDEISTLKFSHLLEFYKEPEAQDDESERASDEQNGIESDEAAN